ncbi:MAG: ABC transporter permease [candidate division KSB1 bacterium]|nr:ABC transporter permease [candidate division KSB1 bacterium]
MQRIRFIIKKEFLQIRRDPAMRVILIALPIIQLLLLGYVVSSEVKNISTAICDLDRSPLSRSLVQKIIHSNYFDVKAFVDSPTQLQALLDAGRVSMAVIFPQNFARQTVRGEQTTLQVIMDGQEVNTAQIALGYLNGVLEDFLQQQMETLQQSVSSPVRFVRPNIRLWYNPNAKNSDYMIPGLVVFLLTIVTALLSSMGLVREREIGTMEQLLVAPIKKHELIIGKIVPFAVIGIFELALGLSFAKLWYNIPIVGNLLILLLFAVIYLFTTLGLGLFVSATAHTQQQAMFLSWFIMIFVFLMSGLNFPIDNMPRAAQLLTYLNPMRYFVIVIRELLIKGSGLKYLYPQGLALAAFGEVIFSIAVWRFQNRIK